MIFFLVMPGLFGGLGNTHTVLYAGAPEVAYPRVNNMSVLIIPSSYTIIMLSLICEFGCGIGWTLYPLSLSLVGIDIIMCALLVSGIPSSEYENVFKPFYKLDKSRNQTKSSVGLGLSIASDIIRSHGGNIELGRSEMGGLKIKIFLPV